MKMLALIPARGNSKGVPGKNIKLLNGRPLIYYTLDAASAIFSREDICVSTDSLEIKCEVEKYGITVPFFRPVELATDHAPSIGVYRHAIAYYENKGVTYDVIVVLQPTSPFRAARHVIECIRMYTPDIDMVVSVKETKANPYFVLFEEDNEGYLVKSKPGNFGRRQDCPAVWEYNGAVYVINVKSLMTKDMGRFDRVKKYVMDEWSSIDIDTELDWTISELMVNRRILKGGF